MIYTTLDTCVWLGLIKVDLHNENNVFEEVCYWIENKHLTHITPENIIREWDRNKAKKLVEISNHIKKLHETIIGPVKETIDLASIYQPDAVEDMVSKRIDRVDTILKVHSEIASENSTIYDEAIRRNFNCLAPNHSSDSFRDTINIFTIINHIKTKNYENCIFSTINHTDFSEGKIQKHILHNQLTDDFKNANLQYVYCDESPFANKLLGKILRPVLPNFQEYFQKKTLAEQEVITVAAIEIPDADYLENIKHLDLILAKNTPTAFEQGTIVKSLIERHDSYKQYFFNNIPGTKAWFNFLKSEGYFDSDKTPDFIQDKDGYIKTPFWESLGYLQKLSFQISQGKEIELIDELLAVIKNISEHPKDNHITWYNFIKILSHIPKDRIPKEILDLIPVWLTGKLDMMLQTSVLFDDLLPRFLNDDPTPEDIEKAEIILRHLFQIEKKSEQEQKNVWRYRESSSYRSKIYLGFLANQSEKWKFTHKVAKYCSQDFILDFGKTIKTLLLDNPDGINASLKDGDKEYEVKIYIDSENLLISPTLKDSDVANETIVISNWEEKSETELEQELISALKQQNISYIPTDKDDDVLKRLNFAISTDILSIYGFSSIRKLCDRYDTGKVLNIFSSIFRDLLDEKTKQNPEKGIELLKTLCYDKKYRLPFYKRITLYIICENWEATKSLFFELIKDNDALHLFSDHIYEKELYDLLNRNQNVLNDDELKIIESIIEQGCQDKISKQFEESEYWKLRWYSALKDTELFKNKYLEFSKALNRTSEDYENSGEVQFRTGYVSPISVDDLLEKSNQEIANSLKTFNPKRSFDDPSVAGLAGTFELAVETEPEKFTTEIELYQEIPYIHSSRMLNAFGEAWKKQKTFDWEKVLRYCLEILRNPKFYKDELLIDNEWGATSDWTVRSIANLLTNGLQNDKHSFDINLLPLAKEIILIIVSNLKRVDDFKIPEDYPTYLLNSTAGTSLRALLSYSLHRARNLFKHEDNEKWESDIKSLYEEILKKGILDAFILEGWHFEQFYYLDKDWIIGQVKQHYNCEDREWLAFMGGFTVGKPPFNKELYTIFYPHYERMIDKNIRFENIGGNNGLVRHLTAFYFWKYETLSDEKLLFKFLNQAPPNEISKLIHFVWQQEDYPKTLSELGQQEFRQRMVELWTYLADKYENSSIEEEQKNLATLSNWIVFVPELNELYANLILKSCKYVDKTYSTHELLENLVTLKTKGNPNTTAEAIGKIISSLEFRNYLLSDDENFIKDLVLFLFDHGQKQVALEFCNKMASNHQRFFLREIYEANTKTT